MKLYEITYIAREEGDPGVATAIQAAAGRITSERSMGRRQFAYPIGKETAGYYTTLRFNAPGEELAELNRTLSLNPGIVRFLIVAVPELKLESVDLNVEDLKEAKELEKETGTSAEGSTSTEASTEEQQKQLDEKLGKLLESDEELQ